MEIGEEALGSEPPVVDDAPQLLLLLHEHCRGGGGELGNPIKEGSATGEEGSRDAMAGYGDLPGCRKVEVKFQVATLEVALRSLEWERKQK